MDPSILFLSAIIQGGDPTKTPAARQTFYSSFKHCLYFPLSLITSLSLPMDSPPSQQRRSSFIADSRRVPHECESESFSATEELGAVGGFQAVRHDHYHHHHHHIHHVLPERPANEAHRQPQFQYTDDPSPPSYEEAVLGSSTGRSTAGSYNRPIPFQESSDLSYQAFRFPPRRSSTPQYPALVCPVGYCPL